MARLQFDLPAEFLFSTDVPIYISCQVPAGYERAS